MSSFRSDFRCLGTLRSLDGKGSLKQEDGLGYLGTLEERAKALVLEPRWADLRVYSVSSCRQGPFGFPRVWPIWLFEHLSLSSSMTTSSVSIHPVYTADKPQDL